MGANIPLPIAGLELVLQATQTVSPQTSFTCVTVRLRPDVRKSKRLSTPHPNGRHPPFHPPSSIRHPNTPPKYYNTKWEATTVSPTFYQTPEYDTTPYDLPPQVPDGAFCTDVSGCYDKDGPDYDCNWYDGGYSGRSNCDWYGPLEYYANAGHTANSA
jgi:hypothetical protein